MRLLLLSNSTNHGGRYLHHAREAVAKHLSGVRDLVFVPYALADWDSYTARARQALASLGVEVAGIHTAADPVARVAQADAIFVGGGNTFRLISALQRTGLLGAISTAVRAGTPYMGASAGTNIASPSLRTTNDMPIVEPSSFDALGLVPFQINPHYLDPDPTSTHNGETRAERIEQFLEENDVAVLGLREGTYLRVTTTCDTASAVIGGVPAAPGAPGPAVLFERGSALHEVDGDISELLSARPRFDVPGA